MSYDRTRKFKQLSFKAGDILNNIKVLASDYGVSQEDIAVYFSEKLQDGTSIDHEQLDDLGHVCNINTHIRVSFRNITVPTLVE